MTNQVTRIATIYNTGSLLGNASINEPFNLNFTPSQSMAFWRFLRCYCYSENQVSEWEVKMKKNELGDIEIDAKEIGEDCNTEIASIGKRGKITVF